MAIRQSGIMGCEIVPVSANRDERGCLFEIYRQSWPGLFAAVQWNACASGAGVVRGAHVHVDYEEFYTLPKGRVILGLADIRRHSPTFRRSVQFTWTDSDAIAVIIPRGVAHVVLFEEDSVLAFGLSDYWKPEYDVVGCQWDAPELGFDWPDRAVRRSRRDIHAGGFGAMVEQFEDLTLKWQTRSAVPALA